MTRFMRMVLTVALLAGTVAALGGCGAEEKSTEKASLSFIEFYDPDCPFCQKMEPIVDQLRSDYESKIDSFEIIDVTTDEGKAKVEEFGVFLTPTFVLLDGNGDELDRVTGATTEENMVKFVDRGIADVSGEGGGPRDTIEGEGTQLN